MKTHGTKKKNMKNRCWTCFANRSGQHNSCLVPFTRTRTAICCTWLNICCRVFQFTSGRWSQNKLAVSSCSWLLRLTFFCSNSGLQGVPRSTLFAKGQWPSVWPCPPYRAKQWLAICQCLGTGRSWFSFPNAEALHSFRQLQQLSLKLATQK